MFPRPRFEPCRCAVTRRQTLSPVSEIMPDRRTPELRAGCREDVGASLPYPPCPDTAVGVLAARRHVSSVETARQRTIRVGARLEKEAVTSAKVAEPTLVETKSIALSIDGGHLRSVRHYQVRSFDCPAHAQVTNDDGKQIVFSSVPAAGNFPNRISWHGFLHKLGDDSRSLRSRFSAMGRKVRARSAKRPVQAQLIMCLTGSTSRCGSSMLIRQPKADRTSPRAIARRVRISLKSSIGFADVCGTARSLGPSISSAKRLSRSTVSPTARSWPPWPHERWRVCCAISRHIFVDNPISSSITPRRGSRTSRLRRRSRKVPCRGCCTGE